MKVIANVLVIRWTNLQDSGKVVCEEAMSHDGCSKKEMSSIETSPRKPNRGHCVT
jgi:hypothetical protein